MKTNYKPGKRTGSHQFCVQNSWILCSVFCVLFALCAKLLDFSDLYCQSNTDYSFIIKILRKVSVFCLDSSNSKKSKVSISKLLNLILS